MPQAIPYLIAIGKKIALAVAQAAIAYGVTELLGLNDAPEPDSQKFPVKQPIPPVQFAYGEGRLSGPLLYWRTIGNVSIDIIALCDATAGPVESIDSFFLNDDAVTMDGDIVERGADGRYRRDGGEDDTIRILSRLGETPSPAYAEVITASDGEWTSAHRADAVATMAIIAKGVKAELTQTIYPNGPVQGSAVGKWLRCYDWRADSTMPGGDGPQRRDDPSTWVWTRNPVVAHVHNEWHVFGQDFDYRFLPTLAQLTVAADVCEEQVPLKAGGTIDRYRIFAVFNSKTPPKQVRQLFTQSYDGLWIERGDGAFVVLAGVYTAPTVVLNEDRIQRFRWRKVRRQEDVCNSLVIAYNSPAHGFTMVETQPWQDAASVAALGEYPQPFELRWVDNNSQARRLAKSAFAKINAEYDGFVDVDLSEDEAELEQRFFRIRNQAAPASMWDVVVLATAMTLDLQNRRVRIEFIKADPTAWDWDAATEEGDGPGVAPTAPVQETPAPVIDQAEVFFTGGDPRLRVVIEDPGRDDYGFALRWRVVGEGYVTEYPDGQDLSGSLVELLSGLLPVGTEVEFGVAFIPSTGNPGPWTDYPSPISTVQEIPAPTDLVVSDLETVPSSVSISWRNPSQPFGWVIVYRAETAVFPGPSGDVGGPMVGGMGGVMLIEDDVPGGVYYYWVQSFAEDGTPGGITGPEMVALFYEPGGNILVDPEDFSSGSWAVLNGGGGAASPVVTANFAAAPDGSMTADKIEFVRGSSFSMIRQDPAVVIGETYDFGVWLRSDTPGASIALRMDGVNGGTLTLTGDWTRYTLSAAATASTMAMQLILFASISGAPATATLEAWGAQVPPA